MNIEWGLLKTVIRKHRFALCVAIFVGIVYVAPHALFMLSLGDNYRGIPMMMTANEDFYLARIQEILDGHPLLGSPLLFEYKDQWPLSPPVGEMFYAIPAMIFATSPVTILLISRFLLPAILFFLVYFLMYQLDVRPETASRKINAMAGALLVLFGYDLVDFRNVLGFLAGHHPFAGGFLLWSRPVNPILGAIFLMSFLICVWRIMDGTKYKRAAIFCASVFLALMTASYFFSWGMAISILAVLIVIYFFKKEYPITRRLVAVVPLALLWSAPYWYMVFRAHGSEWYRDSVLRSGLFYTHYPILNKLVLAALVFFMALVFAPFVWRKMRDASVFNSEGFFRGFTFQKWQWFCFSLIAGSFWVYSQQMITGMTIWPYHFVQYSIPLMMIVVVITFRNVVGTWRPYVWMAGIGVVICASLFSGIYTQASVYREFYVSQAARQPYRSLFSWLNMQEKDCVVLARRDDPDRHDFSYDMNILIPAFTHCNSYATDATSSLMPAERPRYNYMAILRLKGVSASAIDDYLLKNKSEAMSYLFSNWKGLYNPPDFPDFSDPMLGERLKNFPSEYKRFMAQDFESALKKYRLDYIASIGALSPDVVRQFRHLKTVFASDDLFVYQIHNE